MHKHFDVTLPSHAEQQLNAPFYSRLGWRNDGLFFRRFGITLQLATSIVSWRDCDVKGRLKASQKFATTSLREKRSNVLISTVEASGNREHLHWTEEGDQNWLRKANKLQKARLLSTQRREYIAVIVIRARPKSIPRPDRILPDWTATLMIIFWPY